MDDDEYGQYARAKAAGDEQRMLGYRQALQTTFMQARDQVLKVIPDQAAREALEARANDFATYTEFVEEAFKIKATLAEAKMREKLTAEITTSLANQAAAASAGRGPTLGSGLPTQSVNFSSLSSQQKILAGLEENAKKK